MRKPDLTVRVHPDTRSLVARWVNDRLDRIQASGRGSLVVVEDAALRPSLVLVTGAGEREQMCSWYDLDGTSVEPNERSRFCDAQGCVDFDFEGC